MGGWFRRVEGEGDERGEVGGGERCDAVDGGWRYRILSPWVMEYHIPSGMIFP